MEENEENGLNMCEIEGRRARARERERKGTSRQGEGNSLYVSSRFI